MVDYGEEIIGEYDMAYVSSRFRRIKEHKWMERFVNKIEVKGLENLEMLRDQFFVGFSNHKSHFDYLGLGLLFMENLEIEDFPRFVAGINLDSRLLKLIGLDFRKTGAFFVDRERIRELEKQNGTELIRYIKAIEQSARKILERRENFFIFPEGGRNYFGKPMDKMQAGLIGTVAKVESHPFILPVAIDYDKVIESYYFNILDCAKKTKLTRGVYYATDLAAFAARFLFRENRGNMHVNFGKPKKLNEITNSDSSGVRKRELTEYLRGEIVRLYRDIKK